MDNIRPGSAGKTSPDTPRPAKWPNAGCILADDHSIAWRVFDAQYWGVPQRRKRIYLVADLTGQRAGKVLFESEGLSGYTPEGFRSWQGTAGSAEECPGTPGGLCLNDQGGERMDVSEDVAGTLRAQDHGHPPAILAAGFCTEHSARARSIGFVPAQSRRLYMKTTARIPASKAQWIRRRLSFLHTAPAGTTSRSWWRRQRR